MNGPVIANIVTPKYFKFYHMGTLRNDDNDLMIEEKMMQFMQVDEQQTLGQKIANGESIGDDNDDDLEDAAAKAPKDPMSVAEATSEAATEPEEKKRAEPANEKVEDPSK